MTLQAVIDYSGYDHVLWCGVTFVHPVSGNLYLVACEKDDSVHQNLSIYRMTPGIVKWELIKRYIGNEDAQSVFHYGAAIIDRYGALIVGTTCWPKNMPKVTGTGFVAAWDWIPGVDLPWDDDTAVLKEQIAALQQQVATLQAQIGDGNGLTADEIRWVRGVRAVE